jgi:hypothetical protein
LAFVFDENHAGGCLRSYRGQEKQKACNEAAHEFGKGIAIGKLQKLFRLFGGTLL